MFQTDFCVVQDIPGKGRGVIATEDIPVGTPLFTCESIAACFRNRRNACYVCTRISHSATLTLECECEAHYCSIECQEYDREHRMHHLICKTRQNIIKMKDRKLDKSEKELALFLVDILGRRHITQIQKEEAEKSNLKEKFVKELNKNENNIPEVIEDTSSQANSIDKSETATKAPSSSQSPNTNIINTPNHQLPLPFDDPVEGPEDEILRLPSPTFDNYIFQCDDYPEHRGYQYREETRQKVVKAVQKSIGKEFKPKKKLNFEELMCVSRKDILNSFYIQDGRHQGWAVYPQASMINHSCYPNSGCLQVGNTLRFYAMRPILAGEEIVQSYCSSDQKPENWGFTCTCDKCVGKISEAEYTEFREKYRCHCGTMVPITNKDRCACRDGVILQMA